jgi:hypothetical protein
MSPKKIAAPAVPLTASLAELLAARRSDPDWSPRHEALASVAVMLAGTLDDGAGLATAGITKEYRSVLVALTEVTDVGGSLDALLAELSANMGDQAKN